MFSELVTIKQRLEDLTPKKEVKDLIIPVEGSAVQAHARQLSSQLRLRSDAQLSGALSVGALALLAQVRSHPDLKTYQVVPAGIPLHPSQEWPKSARFYNCTCARGLLPLSQCNIPVLLHIMGLNP